MRIYLGVVKIATGIDAANGLRYLQDAVADTDLKWHNFEQYAFMDAVLRLGEKLPAPLVNRIRERLAESFNDDLGFTDNHSQRNNRPRCTNGVVSTTSESSVPSLMICGRPAASTGPDPREDEGIAAACPAAAYNQARALYPAAEGLTLAANIGAKAARYCHAR